MTTQTRYTPVTMATIEWMQKRVMTQEEYEFGIQFMRDIYGPSAIVMKTIVDKEAFYGSDYYEYINKPRIIVYDHDGHVLAPNTDSQRYKEVVSRYDSEKDTQCFVADPLCCAVFHPDKRLFGNAVYSLDMPPLPSLPQLYLENITTAPLQEESADSYKQSDNTQEQSVFPDTLKQNEKEKTMIDTYRQLTLEELYQLFSKKVVSKQDLIRVVTVMQKFYGPNAYKMVVDTYENGYYDDGEYYPTLYSIKVYNRAGDLLAPDPELEASKKYLETNRDVYSDDINLLNLLYNYGNPGNLRKPLIPIKDATYCIDDVHFDLPDLYVKEETQSQQKQPVRPDGLSDNPLASFFQN